MKQFEVNIMVTSEDDADAYNDATVDVTLPDGTSVNDEQLAVLTKRLAGVIGDFIRENYQHADVLICT